MLRDAVIRGDVQTARRLVLDGADVNAVDAERTSVIGALVLGAADLDEVDASRVRASAPGRLVILSFLLDRRAFSLYALNAAHASLRGLTPLGMAAYLNRLDFVSVLLEKGDGLVLVDGIDSHRATPTMYAARDGHTDVLRYLVRQGARPDSVDCHHRSVLFYAVSEPQCLWTCEQTLRLRRAESLLSQKKKRRLKLALQYDANKYISLAALYQQQHAVFPLSQPDLVSSVKSLVNAITSSDIHATHTLLFPSPPDQKNTPSPPALVNFPDARGWAPIHYCVAAPRPSTRVLDALFLAGADLALYTADNACAPLHVLARAAGDGASAGFRLYAFAVHLVRDLGAPLAAVDARGDTCMHVAAREGRCADVLMAFLECDPEGVVCKMRNNEGQTALDVAKAEFRIAFEPEDGSMRPDSAASMRTIKATFSSSSLASSYSSASSDSSSSLEDDLELQEQFPPLISRENESRRTMLSSSVEAEQLLEALGEISEQLAKVKAPDGSDKKFFEDAPDVPGEIADLDDVEGFLHHAWHNSADLLEQYRLLVDAELEDLHSARAVHAALEQLVGRLVHRARCAAAQACAQTQKPPLRVCTSLGSFRLSAPTPALVASSAHSSFASLTDLAALATPSGSPSTSAAELACTPGISYFGAVNADLDADADAEYELDFACALAAGSATRLRRASALGAALNRAPDSPLEAGVNLVSVSPERVPEVASPVRRGASRRAHARESWLNPYVRRANSETFQAHLANLLEIEKTLFGAEDEERECALDVDPDAGLALEGRRDWREGVEALQEEFDGDFLEMAGGEDHGYGPSGEFLDLYSCQLSPVREESPEEEPPLCSLPSTSGILDMAKSEVIALEEAMNNAERYVASAQQYVGQAERLTSKIFRAKEHAIQAARLALALRSLGADDVDDDGDAGCAAPYPRRPARSATPEAPAPSPIVCREQHLRPQRAVRSVGAMHALTSSGSRPVLGALALAKEEEEDMCALRRLLLHRVPVRLDSAVDEVDRVAAWVGVVQAVVRNVQHTRL